MNISVIICCYNSEKRIVNTLYHLSRCVLSCKVINEVILVDNNSSDKTAEVAMEYWDSINCKDILRIYIEKKPGLAYARKKGLSECKNEIVVFCDDDNWLQPSYFIRLGEHFNNSKIGAVGGRGIPIANVKVPDWFFENLDAYACSEQTSKMLYGASLAIRTHLLERFYCDIISEKLKGRTKDSLESGEDNLLCEFIKKEGYILLADNTPFCHFMENNRLEVDYLFKLAESFGKATASIRQNTLLFDFFYLTSKCLFALLRCITKKYKIIYLKREFFFIKGYMNFRIGIKA
ncbi:glycosyltransferase family 2 protein [Salmonella enterica]|uniref:Glycosyltransferase n=1 Tax=Salmonella enterica TaxID=28901 RepID=U3GK77_SALER|nr:glycosyltransferase [Salmonella enterica]